MDFSPLTLGIGCLLVAFELINCCDLIPKEMFQCEQKSSVSFKVYLK